MNERQLQQHQCYLDTRDILLGKQSIDPTLKPFMEWFEKTYAQEIASVFLQLINFPNHVIKTPIPVLSIYFKHTKDLNKVREENPTINNRKTNQVIGEKFNEFIVAQGLNQEDVLNETDETKENSKNIGDIPWIYLYSFEYYELTYVKRSIHSSKLEALVKKINNKALSTIISDYSGITIILFTTVQASIYKNSEEVEKWKDLIFELIEAQNELVYFNRSYLKHEKVTSQESRDKFSKAMSSYR